MSSAGTPMPTPTPIPTFVPSDIPLFWLLVGAEVAALAGAAELGALDDVEVGAAVADVEDDVGDVAAASAVMLK